ncbi:predicted protein [Chaetoceros tenuissimus]|uniref:Uncharacterized protein n=1 Tax=Chaetoceros tenuissimus TaxID=426638 RepID=A0AAD3CT17_9STRA|nr:predicted protein [Chaetoceros tenuissimus]
MMKSLKSFAKKWYSRILVKFSSTNEGKLAEAAQVAPPRTKAIICHRSVLYWIYKAGLITKQKFNQIQQSTRADQWSTVLANNTYTPVLNFPQGLANVPRGAIIGFIDPSMLQHSMVVVGHDNGEAYVAGVNNVNVLTENDAFRVGIKHAVVTANQFKPLNPHTQVYWVDVDTVVARLP